MQVDTPEGADDGNDELMQWLADNKLLKAKQQFIEYDVSMDDLQSIDIQNDLNDFVQTDLKLSGIIASRAKKAIEQLQQKSYVALPQSSSQKIFVHVVLSQEEDEAINGINNKCKEVTTYLNTLNSHIKKLKNISKKNREKINTIESEIINKIKIRMNELKAKSDGEVNKKQQEIIAHINTVKLYESSLNDAQAKHNKLLTDDKLDKTKRKIKIMEVNQNVTNGNVMNNKPKLDPILSVEIDKGKVMNFIKGIGSINNLKYPKLSLSGAGYEKNEQKDATSHMAKKVDDKPEQSSKFQLYYWKGMGGRGTLVRLCMSLCGVTWNEKNQDHWKDVKGAHIKGFPNFAMPILQDKNNIISQTPAICVYMMEKYGFAPVDPLEKVHALQVALTAHDASGEWYAKINKLIGFDGWITMRIGSFLSTLENQLKRNNEGKGWFFGDKPCVADVFVADFMRRYKFNKADHYKACKFSVLKAHCKRFEELERVKKYLESDAYKKVRGASGWGAL